MKKSWREGGRVVSFSDPFLMCALESNNYWAEGKDLGNRVYRPSTGNSCNAGAVRMECTTVVEECNALLAHCAVYTRVWTTWVQNYAR